ncbi:uncharacterized protein LOC117606753 isoform X2 [Osmia lignaria lignaria]|uniref:uncharacterized protein LOC117606753 isoform X2 n=1 Tax=Osmia lignaria lignaria TaxID=1437193 RepID=UPI00402B3EFB
MNLPISTSDFFVTASDCGELLTRVKLDIEQLESAMQHHIDDYLKEVIDTNVKTDADNKKQNIDFDKHMELWMNDLKQQLINLQFFGCDA